MCCQWLLNARDADVTDAAGRLRVVRQIGEALVKRRTEVPEEPAETGNSRKHGRGVKKRHVLCDAFVSSCFVL